MASWMPFHCNKCRRKNVKFCVSRHWLELANQWLEATRQFLWLDSIKSWLWLEKILDDSDSKGLWLWLDKNDEDTSLLLAAMKWKTLPSLAAAFNTSKHVCNIDDSLELDYTYEQWWTVLNFMRYRYSCV